MAPRKKSSKSRRVSKRSAPKKPSQTKNLQTQNLMQTAERAVLSQSNKMLVGATKQYKRLTRLAAKATNDKRKQKYLTAALSAVVVAGIVANDLRQRIAARRPSRKARTKRSSRT
jgi:hypothetical protein